MLRFGCLLWMICFVQLSYAQDIPVVNDSIDIEEITISSTRVNSTEPLTIQDYTQQEIEKIYVGQDPVSLIQDLSPSIMTYTDGGTDIGNYSQFRIRGMDQDRVNISLNGVPLNDMVDHGVYFSNFSDLGNSVESMQLVRGAGGSSKGTASYAGSVNFESLNLFDSEASSEIQLTTGSFGTLRTAAEVSTGLVRSNIGAYARMTRTQTDGYKYNSGSDSYSFFGSVGYLGDDEMLKLTAFSGKTQNGQSYEHVPLSVINQDPKTNYNNLNDVDDFEQHMVQLQYTKSLSQQSSLHITPYYNGAGGVFPYTFDGVQYMYGLDNNHVGLMANIQSKSEKHSWNIGGHGYVFDRTNFEYVSPFVTEPYSRDFTDKKELSTYVKYSKTVDKLDVYATGEVRYIKMDMEGDESLGVDLDIENNWTFINGMLGVSYAISDNSNSYLSLGRTGREPTRSDIMNDVVNPETVYDLELGYKIKTNHFALNSNVFYMTFQNEISKIGALQERSYIEIRQNIDASQRYGIELSGSYQPSEKLRWYANAAYMKSNIESYMNGSTYTNVEQIFTPNILVQSGLTWSLLSNVTFGASGRYASRSYTELSNNEEYILPSHLVLNSHVTYTHNDRLSLMLHLNNVLDTEYYTEGSPIDGDYDGIFEEVGYRIQPPRNMYVMIKYAF